LTCSLAAPIMVEKLDRLRPRVEVRSGFRF
jgi:hypothetical protein